MPEAQEALDSLKLLTLVFESSGNRTTGGNITFSAAWVCPTSPPRCWAC